MVGSENKIASIRKILLSLEIRKGIERTHFQHFAIQTKNESNGRMNWMVVIALLLIPLNEIKKKTIQNIYCFVTYV